MKKYFNIIVLNFLIKTIIDFLKSNISFISNIYFYRNLLMSFNIPIIKKNTYKNFIISGITFESILDLERFIKFTNNDYKLDFYHKILFWIIRKKMIFVAYPKNIIKTKSIAAINIYYFNKIDRKENLNTIHEGIISVDPLYRDLGLATAMRKFAKNHFSKSNISGISTKIDISNTFSLKSAVKNGFIFNKDITKKYCLENEKYLIARINYL